MTDTHQDLPSMTAGVLACDPVVVGIEADLGQVQATMRLPGVRGVDVEVRIDGVLAHGVKGVAIRATPEGDVGELRVRRGREHSHLADPAWLDRIGDVVHLSLVVCDRDGAVRTELRPLPVRLGRPTWSDRDGVVPLLAVPAEERS